MALGAGILLGGIAVLAPEQGSAQHGEPHLDRQHTQGDQREQPAVEHHHHDVDHREGGIEQRGEGLAGEEFADLLQLRHPGAQLPHRPAVEVRQWQPQQVIDHLGAEAQIEAVGGLGEQEGAQGADQPFQHRHHHQGDAQHLQSVEAALADHLVDDHLDQQGVGQAEQLHHEGGHQHLQQNAAVALQRRPEPGEAEALLWRAAAALHQQHLDPLGVGGLDLGWGEFHPAIAG